MAALRTLPIALLAAGAVVAGRARTRLALSQAKHRSLTGHARMARRVARLVPSYAFEDEAFFRADDAPAAVAARRRDAFGALAGEFGTRFAKSRAMTEAAARDISDLQFTGAYRVPFQFSAFVKRHLGFGSFLAESGGAMVTDLDGNRLFDLTGSYGVNLFGLDAQKSCIDEGAERVRALGPVLGSYHPLVADNARRLRTISGLDEVSFHMSGTEAVMQAVRLARYHTGRSHLVRFCGAYHGWWGEVQPGIGNPTPADRTYTLAEMSEKTLQVLRTRRDIACVLVNPLQALHPNAGAPADSALIDGSRRAGFDRAAYAAWLAELRSVCDARGIVLIFDEVFVGFRLAPGGAQEFFGVRADMVTYGKGLGGGLPVGVLCGKASLMRRFRDDRPADICFARGTFNSHPYVMGAMNVFLERQETADVRSRYAGLTRRWDDRASTLNARLEQAGLPVAVANLSTIWTVLYRRPSRYNWMLQFYLRAEGIALSWVGTGRLIFTLDLGEAEFAAVADRFVAACVRMERDGWWWCEAGRTDRDVRRRVLREMARKLILN